MTEQQKVRWGILGPGGIARAFAGGLARSRSGALIAIGARNPGKPEYGEHFVGARVHHGYEALLADPEVEAVYIATLHPQHAQWAIKAAEAGKHVLCEKPMGLTAFQAEAMFRAAGKAGTFMGEAFMYRLHPMTQKIIDLVTSGAIGEVRVIKSNFGFAMPHFDPAHRLYANDLAGGGILDVGCYPVSMTRLIAGAVAGKPFLDPETVAGVAHLGETGVDEWAAAVLKFPGGIVGEVSCSISLAQDNMLRILGTKGRIEVKDFWFATGQEGGTTTIDIIDSDGTHRPIEVTEPAWLYCFEAEAASQAILAGETQFSSPGMSRDDTLGNMAVLDKWRQSVGLEYEIEKPASRSRRPQ